LTRKKAALAACLADTAQAKKDLENAQEAAVIGQLAAIVAEAEKLAQKLDHNITNAVAWGTLAQLHRESSRLLLLLNGRAQAHHMRELFESPQTARARVYDWHAETCDQAMGNGRGYDARSKATSNG
jgi:hypothetical protein